MDTVHEGKRPSLKILARNPSVSMPAKPREDMKKKRVELEDPYTEATCVADGAPDDANDGCSLGKNKKKRYMIVNISESE
ncbi:hypothetical protein Tco_1294511 [Tanacetum coccineum]